MSTPYWQKLQDPRWQRTRLKIFERDAFACQCCTNEKRNRLELHHRYYVSGREPWEYPDSALITVCSVCHDALRHDKATQDFEKLDGIMQEIERDPSMAGWNGNLNESIEYCCLVNGVQKQEVLFLLAMALGHGWIDHESLTAWRANFNELRARLEVK